MPEEAVSLREKMIEQGIIYLTIEGTSNFSIREIARRCGVSCAAPFKHFKDKQDYFGQITEYLDACLMREMETLAEQYEGDVWNTYVEMTALYIEYIVAHPFLMDLSFWRTISNEGMTIRRWKSFQKVIEYFRIYVQELTLTPQEYKQIYFSMQNLTYGFPYMAIASLLTPSVDYSQQVREQVWMVFRPYRERQSDRN